MVEIHHRSVYLHIQAFRLETPVCKKQLILQLQKKLDAIPEQLSSYQLSLDEDGQEITYSYDTQGERTGITALMRDLAEVGVRFKDLKTRENSLEDIFVSLVRRPR